MTLYHGSSTYIKNELVPHKSFHYKPYVYATTDFNYALLRAGKFNPNKFMLKEDYDGNIITLVELYRGAFIDALYTEGYIYVVDDCKFEHTIECMPCEYISTMPSEIKFTFVIGNVFKEIMNSSHFKLIYYEEADEYWKTVRGGRERYLQRRRERVEKLRKDNVWE